MNARSAVLVARLVATGLTVLSGVQLSGIARAGIALSGIVLSGIAPLTAAQRDGSAPPLPDVGAVVERRLTRQETHVWTAAVTAGDYVEVWFEPIGLTLNDVEQWPRLTVTDADGAVVADENGPHVALNADVGARMVVAFVAKRGGDYVVRLAAGRQTSDETPYRLRVRARRAATAADQVRLEVQRLWRDGVRLFVNATREQQRAAVEKFDAALALIGANGDAEDRAVTLMTKAAVHYGMSDAVAGRAAVTQALSIWQELGRERETGLAYSDLGLLAYLAYEHAEARTQYDRALVLLRASADAEGEAVTMVRLGWIEFAAGEMARVIALDQDAIQLLRRIGRTDAESVAHNDLGRAYAELGDVSQALDAYRAALAARPGDVNPRGASVTLMRIGQLHLSVADWQAAFEAFQEALPLAGRAHDVRNEASIVLNLGLAYSRVGDGEQAQRFLERAIQLARTAGIRNAEANALAGLGVEAYYGGDLDRSRTLFQQALAIQTAIGDVRAQAVTLRYLASTQLALGAPRDALASISDSIAKSESAVSPSALATLAATHAALSDPAQADTIYQRAIERARQIRARDQEASVLTLYGRFLARQDRYTDARAHLEQAVAIHETLREGLGDSDQRMNYASRSTAPYEAYVEVLMALERRQPGSGFARDAFRTAERARGRGLLELLAASNVDVLRGVDRELVARERSLRWRLNARAAIQTSLLLSSTSNRRLAQLEQDISELSRSWREATAHIRQQSPAFNNLVEPQPLSATDVSALLDGDTVLLELASGDAHSWLFALTRDSFDSYGLPSREHLDGLARDVHRLLTARQPVAGETSASRQARVRRADRELRARARELSDAVLGPIADRLASEWRGRRLVIVATGGLAYVPIAALPTPGAQPSVPLVARHEIVMLPSASSLTFLRGDTPRRVATKTLAVVADPVFAADDPRVGRSPRGAVGAATATRPSASGASPSPSPSSPSSPPGASAAASGVGNRGSLARLPFSRVEADAVTAQASSSSILQATDFEASLDLATSGRLNDYRIVHLATHGVIDTARPELSGLALSLVDRTGRARDGFLRLNTIYNLRLSADLVVLSACQTALGKEVAGEGLIGLTRGFMQAGARRVIASLWQVNDAATAELMKRFYTGLLQQRLPAAAALRRAQREMAADPRWSAPYFWAGFVLQGDWQP